MRATASKDRTLMNWNLHHPAGSTCHRGCPSMVKGALIQMHPTFPWQLSPLLTHSWGSHHTLLPQGGLAASYRVSFMDSQVSRQGLEYAHLLKDRMLKYKVRFQLRAWLGQDYFATHGEVGGELALLHPAARTPKPGYLSFSQITHAGWTFLKGPHNKEFDGSLEV